MSTLQTQANNLLDRIERVVVHVHYRTRIAMLVLLQRTDAAEQVQRTPPTIRQIENYADAWSFLVPSSPTERAALAHVLAARYPLSEKQHTNIQHTLGLNTQQVQTAYNDQFDQNLTTLYTSKVAPYQPDLNDHLLQRASWHHIGQGEELVRAGAPADTLYILVDGALHASAPGNTAPEALEPGDMIGDIALWSGDQYTRTVTAQRDSNLVALRYADFHALAGQYPHMMRIAAAHTVQRIHDGIHPHHAIPTTETFTLLPTSPPDPRFIPALVAELDRFGPTLLLSPAELQTRLDEFTGETIDEIATSYDFRDWLNAQHAHYRYIILVGDATYPEWTRRAGQLANHLLIIGTLPNLQQRHPIEALLAESVTDSHPPRQDLVILHEKRQHNQQTAACLTVRDIHTHHHLALAHPPDMARLVRHLRGKAIGIVFGGGGMRGMAHLGVLQALHELGIPLDMAGGTSSGAIVAGQVGLGWDVPTMRQRTEAQIMTRKAKMQFTLPIVSLSSAHAINAALEDMFGGVDIEDLWTPIFTIATNLTQARMEVMQAGSLHRAVRASSSLAGVHPPTIATNNDLLIDGGSFNNTPADIMRQRVGRGAVLAIDMGFTRRHFPSYNYGDSLSGWRVLWNRLNPFRQKKLNVPLISTIMLRANALWSIQATSYQIAHADLVLRPPVGEYGLFDLEAADDLFQAGYTHAMQVLPPWLEDGALTGTLASP